MEGRMGGIRKMEVVSSISHETSSWSRIISTLHSLVIAECVVIRNDIGPFDWPTNAILKRVRVLHFLIA